MPTFNRGFLVLDAHGRMVGIASGPDEAGEIAEAASGKQPALWLAATLPDEPPPRRNHSEPSESVALRAWRASGVPKVDFDRALRMRLTTEIREAYNDIRIDQGLPPYSKAEMRNIKLVSSNAKTSKVAYPTRRGEKVVKAGCEGVSLAPARISFEEAKRDWREQRRSLVTDDTLGHTFCLRSVKECRAACLVGTGQNAIPFGDVERHGERRDTHNYRSKIHRSLLLRRHPEAFVALVVKGFHRWRNKAKAGGAIPFGRLNVLSDLPWELICPEIFDHFKDIHFYDYTKVPGRGPRARALGYHLTFSWSNPHLLDEMVMEMNAGHNLAVPFFHPDNRAASGQCPHGRSVLPKSFLGVPVISGDTHDLRPLDEEHPLAAGGPMIVGLRFKEPSVLDVAGSGAKRSRTEFGAFVVDVYETQADDGSTVYVGSQVPAYTQHGRRWILETADPKSGMKD